MFVLSQGRSLSLVVYQRTARNIQEHFFKNVPTADEVEVYIFFQDTDIYSLQLKTGRVEVACLSFL